CAFSPDPPTAHAVAVWHGCGRKVAVTRFFMEPFGDSPNVLVGARSRAMPTSPLHCAGAASAALCTERSDTSMLVRIPEVSTVLTIVLALLAAKHVPQLSFLPLSQMAGIV